jgi:hypothetical protein
MSRTSSSIGLIARLANRARKLSNSNARKPWRHRAKAIRRTPAEKKLLAEKRAKRKTEYQEALAEARNVIMEQAAILHERFGGHKIEWYFEKIMQCGRLAKHTREPTRWNAYLRSETKKINDGKLFKFSHSSSQSLFRASGGCTTLSCKRAYKADICKVERDVERRPRKGDG